MDKPIILFDGICNLCSWAVQFIIRHDPHAQFRFASLQSAYAQELLAHYGIKQTLDGTDDSVILIENDQVYTHSTASLRVARRLSGILPLGYSFIIVPKFIRDFVYRLIAKSRYRVFGKQTECWIPTPDLKTRFLA
jgi:predicted DCC family thiol-disulfide oxidoreductase YuxK